VVIAGFFCWRPNPFLRITPKKLGGVILPGVLIPLVSTTIYTLVLKLEKLLETLLARLMLLLNLELEKGVWGKGRITPKKLGGVIIPGVIIPRVIIPGVLAGGKHAQTSRTSSKS
jgi:hypothetical protein